MLFESSASGCMSLYGPALSALEDFSAWRKNVSLVHGEMKRKIEVVNGKRLLILNPQGAIGAESIRFMNFPGTSCMGGQIAFVRNFAEGIKAVCPDTKLTIVSQRTGASFLGMFNEGVEDIVERASISYDGSYIDKEGVENNKNAYYSRVSEWGERLVTDKYDRHTPAMIFMNYWDSYLACSSMLDEWRTAGVSRFPKIALVPHSMGYKKFIALLKASVHKEEAANPAINKTEIVNREVKQLLSDQRYLFPSRILAERLMISNPSIKVILNSPEEYDTQLSSFPYTLPFEELRTVFDNQANIRVIHPGIDTEIFGLNNNPDMFEHEQFAEEVFIDRVSKDISSCRARLPVVLALGRLDRGKNFHGLANAYIGNQQLQDRVNLVFVINGSSRDVNKNYIMEMQGLIELHGEEKVRTMSIRLDKFTGAALEQLIFLANITNDPRIKGKWTALSLPAGKDYAGLQRYLGRHSNAVGGLYSLHESYGLAPFETANCGIPVVVSNKTGAVDELVKAGAKSFDPENNAQLAEALLLTLNDFDQIRKAQIDYCSTKSWANTCKQYMEFINEPTIESSTSIDQYPITPFAVDDEDTIKMGERLLWAAVKQEPDL
ncbi:glycosyltransferase [Endozoicomonas elysicola]|uniref:Glycosyl transferase family 1 domain-containing protein n=1 Tax=Endozoicomonas elysicola TaxID=305900 RepID=A0A081KE05_9GAMM|nr:glycosyltransferase [Endozoicomonas elysicola]KEI72381.1 hypothetical protein GV64_18075 [Endozoicomonas elysicola]